MRSPHDARRGNVNDIDEVKVESPRPKRRRERGPDIAPEPADVEVDSMEDAPASAAQGRDIASAAQRRDTKSVAFEILRLFKYTLIGLLIFGLVSEVEMALLGRVSAKELQDFAEGYFKMSSSLLSGVWSPLLAFLLGHYFGRHGRH